MSSTFNFLIYVCLPILPSIISLSIFIICVKNLRNNPMHITQQQQQYRQYTQHFKVQLQRRLACCIEIDVFWAELGKSLSKICLWQLLLLFKRMFALQDEEGFLVLTGPLRIRIELCGLQSRHYCLKQGYLLYYI